MSIGNFVSNVGTTFGFGDPAKVPTAPGVDMSALSYGGDPNMAKNIYNQSNATSGNILGTKADQVQGQTADYTNANYNLDASARTLAGQQAANNYQNTLMSNLQAASYGAVPSAAAIAMRRQSDAAARQQLAMAATSGSPAAMIAAQNNNAVGQGELVAQLGAQRAAEMAQARGELGQVIAQNQQAAQGTAAQQAAMAQQQAGMAQYNTGNIQAAMLANQGANIQQNAANYSGALGFYNAGLGALNNQAQLNEQGQALLQQQYLTQSGLYKSQSDANSAGITGAMSAMGSVAAAGAHSDRRLKKDITPGGSDISDMFRGASASGYAYKDPSMGEADRHYGPMAQDLAKTAAGRSTLIQTPAGLAVNTNRLALANASETGKLRREMDKVKAALRAGAH